MQRKQGNTYRLRAKGEEEKGKKKPLTLTLSPAQTLRVAC
ncbi:hypothetical protein FDUTEX481_00955 [Tolypothrix sp. PCC 7601]|nr:hypothetical protein FDUTEX481_00955 [Tolypothrix sp. PCC 7601]